MKEREFLKVLGARIRELRMEKHMTQIELARECEFEKASMSRIESGQTNITILTLKRISDAMELDLGEFLKK